MEDLIEAAPPQQRFKSGHLYHEQRVVRRRVQQPGQLRRDIMDMFEAMRGQNKVRRAADIAGEINVFDEFPDGVKFAAGRRGAVPPDRIDTVQGFSQRRDFIQQIKIVAADFHNPLEYGTGGGLGQKIGEEIVSRRRDGAGAAAMGVAAGIEQAWIDDMAKLAVAAFAANIEPLVDTAMGGIRRIDIKSGQR